MTRDLALVSGNCNLYFEKTFGRASARLLMQSLDRFGEFRIKRVRKRSQRHPLNPTGWSQEHHACVAFIGDLQPLSPEVLIPVQENCSILQGGRIPSLIPETAMARNNPGTDSRKMTV